jgi:hypothetical protein
MARARSSSGITALPLAAIGRDHRKATVNSASNLAFHPDWKAPTINACGYGWNLVERSRGRIVGVDDA